MLVEIGFKELPAKNYQYTVNCDIVNLESVLKWVREEFRYLDSKSVAVYVNGKYICDYMVKDNSFWIQ